MISMSGKNILYLSITISIAAFFHLWTNNSEEFPKTWICVRDTVSKKYYCSLKCPNGSFSLPGMASCHAWLQCGEKITLISTLFHSVVKKIYLAEWKGHQVILSALSSREYMADFHHNLLRLKSLGPHPFIVQLIGYCNNFVVTQYYELGNALNLHHHLSHSHNVSNDIRTRLSLCFNYASILQYLHARKLVMCDSNTLEKTLSQFLLTDDLKLVVNDLDATPEVTESGIVCGSRKIEGTFVAPEQLWPYPHKEFDVNEMPGYDEKTDIWKLPDVCNWFLGNATKTDVIKYKLFNFHKSCKHRNSSLRPSAKSGVLAYQTVLTHIVNEQLVDAHN